MKLAPCPRLFEAEATRDGRMGGAELASFARHTMACPACRREAQRLEELAEALRASDGAQPDELHALRERTRLVAAFDVTLTKDDRSESRAPAWRRGRWAAAAAALVAGALLFPGPRRAPPIGPAPGLIVQPGTAAVWSKRSDANSERVVLDDGELLIHVDHARRQAKLVVVLPDGELEDTGTTFTVSVANGRTARVAVHEGGVVLRIRGAQPVAIAAGAVWIPQPPQQAAATPTAPAGDPRPSPGPARARAQSPIVSRTATARPVDLPDAADPGAEFRAAVALLGAGANREAAGAFARFLLRHPRDPRAEDATYLRVIALERGGAIQETRRAARAYLQLYPTGFRRTEIEQLSRSIQTSPAESVP